MYFPEQEINEKDHTNLCFVSTTILFAILGYGLFIA